MVKRFEWLLYSAAAKRLIFLVSMIAVAFYVNDPAVMYALMEIENSPVEI